MNGESKAVSRLSQLFTEMRASCVIAVEEVAEKPGQPELTL